MAADGGGAVSLPRDAGAGASRVDDAGVKRRRIRWALFALLPVFLLGAGYLYLTGAATISTDDAYVEADKVGISTDVSGMVKDVDVQENQRVAKGDILFRLDDAPFRFALQRAEAQLAGVRNDIEALKASYREKQQEIALAKSDIAYYQREFQRQQTLAGSHVASQQALDTARHNLDTAQHKAAQLDQQLAQITAQLDGNPDIAIEQHPRYRDALAQRDEAARELAHTVVRAPMDGIVTQVPSLQPGQYLKAATAAFSLVATDHVWVAADPKETQLTDLRAGQQATVTVDAYPGVEWHGTVASISPAAASEFSLLPAQNTSGNWVKVVQRVPIRVRIDTGDAKLPPLRAGMSVELDVATGHERRLPRFLAALFGGGAERSS
jgi:membrane fusion protein (multidrug efflux system)